MTKRQPSSRAKLLLLALLFFGPVGVAMWGYYMSGGWRPAGQTEHGDLVYPASPLAQNKKGAAWQRPSSLRRGVTTGAYSQYTKINRPSHTTSTKCQYQAAASKPK